MNIIDNNNTLRILLIGDCNIGKTSLLLKYLLGTGDSTIDVSGTYKPTTLSIYKCQVEINSEVHNILFTDHNGQIDDYNQAELRKHSYRYERNADIILLCFSLVDRTSFYNITKQWYSEIRQYFDISTPLLLIGTKFDLKKQNQKENSNRTDLNLINRIFKQKQKQARNDIDTNLIDSVNYASGVDFDYLNKNQKVVIEPETIDKNNNKSIKRRECVKLCKLIDAKKYIECSVYNTKSVHKVMNNAIKYAFSYKKDKSDNMLPYFFLLDKTFNTDKVSIDIKNSNDFINNKIFQNKFQTNDDDNSISVTIKTKTKLNCFCCTNRSSTCDSIYDSKL